MTLVADIANVVQALGIIGLLVVTWKWARSQYGATLGSRRHWGEKLNLLACGTTLEYSTQVLGAPAFRRARGLQHYECVFRTPHAWVQLLIDPDDAVERIAITVDDPKFHPQISWLTYDSLNLRLGADSYANVPPPVAAWAWAGARSWGYLERHSPGNPGAYQSFLLGTAQLGPRTPLNNDALMVVTSGGAHGFLEKDTWEKGSIDCDDAAAISLREGSIPNMLVIGRPHITTDMLMMDPVGAEVDYVRVLRPPMR